MQILFHIYLLTLTILSPLNFRCATTCTCHSRTKQVLGCLGSSRRPSNWVAAKKHALVSWWRGEGFHWFIGDDCAETPHVLDKISELEGHAKRT